MSLASMGQGVASLRKWLNFTAVSSSTTNTLEIGMAVDENPPTESLLCGALTVPPVAASFFPGISGRIRTRSVPSFSSDVFCLLHPPSLAPDFQRLLSQPEDLWLIETPLVHRVHA